MTHLSLFLLFREGAFFISEDVMANEKGKRGNGSRDEALIEVILNALEGIKYGHVQITVQDSKVVQVDKIEKFRMCRQKGGDE